MEGPPHQEPPHQEPPHQEPQQQEPPHQEPQQQEPQPHRLQQPKLLHWTTAAETTAAAQTTAAQTTAAETTAAQTTLAPDNLSIFATTTTNNTSQNHLKLYVQVTRTVINILTSLVRRLENTSHELTIHINIALMLVVIIHHVICLLEDEDVQTIELHVR